MKVLTSRFNRFAKSGSLVLLILATLFGATAVNAEPGVTAENFGTLANIQTLKLSPDGTKIAALVNIDGKYTLLTKKLGAKGNKDSYLTDFDKGKFNWFEWANNERLLISVRFPSKRFNQKAMETRLISQNWDTTDQIDMNESHAKKIKKARQAKNYKKVFTSQIQDNVINFLPDDPDHVLMVMDGVDYWQNDVFKVNVYTSKETAVQRSRNMVRRWLSDSDGVVRAGFGYKDRERNISEIIYRESEDASWRTIESYDNRHGGARFFPVGFTNDPNILYVSVIENGVLAYYTWDLKQNKALDKLLPGVNNQVDGIEFNADGSVQSVNYYDEYYRTAFLDKTLSDIHRQLEQMAPGEIISLETWSADKSKLIFLLTSPQRPGDYYYYDVKKNDLKFYGKKYPDIDQTKLAAMNSLTFKARDGLEIPVYVSVPVGAEPANLPTVVLVHGGPHARDVWGYDEWVQFLTTRGYAVLQVNFRGSDGFSQDYYLKGYGQWGEGMLNDVIDGTKWLVENGISDPKKLCVMGGSYGGYAALQTTVIEPDLFKCSVAFAPVADMDDYMGEKSYSYFFDNMKFYVSESEDYSAISPYSNVEKIKTPIMVAHGAQDRRVLVNLSRNFKNRMERNDKSIEYVEFEDGDHFLSLQHNKQDFFKRAEAFLARYLK